MNSGVKSVWKEVFTGVIADVIYKHLERSNLLPPKQKGCKRKSWGTKDQLLIEKDGQEDQKVADNP